MDHSYTNESQVDLISVSEKKYLLSPQRKKFRMNFMNNSILGNSGKPSIEEIKLNEYVNDLDKDQDKYIGIKESMKKKFFKINTSRHRRLRSPPKLRFQQNIEQDDNESKNQAENNLVMSSFVTDRRPATRQQFSKQINKVLEVSGEYINSRGKHSVSKQFKTKSQINRNSKKVIDEQKDQILQFIKKSKSVDIREKKWSEISNQEKFIMDFQTYSKRKTQKQIDKYIYQNKIRRKVKPLDKFQDFILTEVKFSEDHKQKLSSFFTKMRQQFRKAQKHR